MLKNPSSFCLFPFSPPKFPVCAALVLALFSLDHQSPPVNSLWSKRSATSSSQFVKFGEKWRRMLLVKPNHSRFLARPMAMALWWHLLAIEATSFVAARSVVAGEEAVKVGVVANRANSGEAEEEAIGRPPMDDEGSDKSISMILIELKRNQRQRKPIVKKKAPATISLKRKVASTMQKEM